MAQRTVARTRWKIPAAAVCIAGFCCLVAWQLPSPRLLAVPHTITPVEHPFDPDWPDVKLILDTKCVACHRRQTEIMDFSSYDALMKAGVEDETPAISPGQLDDSMLWEYVAWNATAEADSDYPDEPMMPEDRHEWLTANQLQTIKRWIEHGALQYKLPGTCDIRPLMEIDYPSAKQCSICHPKQYAEWSRSMHAYAQHSPVFEAFNLTLIERTSGTIGTFCSRCHTPIGTTLGESASRRNVHRSRIAMEGITCVVCHRRKFGHYKSNGRVQIEPGDLFSQCMYGPFRDPVSSAVAAHPSAPFSYLKSSQFCGECHDVTAPSGVRNEEAFSEWQNSPAAKAGISCQNCHMGPVQGLPIASHQRPLGRAATVPGVDPKEIPVRPLSDHTFAGPDYSLLPDTEFPYKLDWMYETDYRDPLRLTPYQQKSLIELRRKNRAALRKADEKRYEVLRNAARIDAHHPHQVQAGRKFRVDLDVVSLFAGHSFPTGFTEERQIWLSLEVRDLAGKLIFVSGDLDKNGDLRDEHSHAVLTGDLRHDKYLLNLQNNFTALTQKGTERTLILAINRHLQPLNVFRPAAGISISYGRPLTFRIAKGSLPPLKSMRQQYPVVLPCAGVYTVRARLNLRHLPPMLLDQIGAPHLKHLLEIVVIDEHQSVVQAVDE